MMHGRIYVAFVAAPLVGCAVAALGIAGLEGSGTSGLWANFYFLSLVAVPVCLILAFPTFLIWRRRRQVGLPQCLIAGVIFGALGGLLGLLIGLLSASTFWLIAIRQREGQRS